MENRELRYQNEGCEFRASDSDKEFYIEGWALKYDTRSQNLGGFIETIAKGALDGADMDNVLARVNHQSDSQHVVGRTGANLELEVRDEGLFYRVNLDKSLERDRQLHSDVQRGLISKSSFAFSTRKDQWEEREDEPHLRTVLEFDRIFDVAPVYNPAYLDTSVAERSLEMSKTKKEEPKEIEEPRYEHRSINGQLIKVKLS